MNSGPNLSRRHWLALLMVSPVAQLLTACGVGQDGTGAAPDTQSTGVVNGFGSVIVDGVRYDLSRADISSDGTSGRSQTDLRIGMVVTVTGSIADDGASGSADTVSYESLLLGPLDQVPGATTLRVLGQRITIDAATVFDGVDAASALLIGDTLQVSGFIDPSGGFRATWVRKESAAASPQLTGFVTAVNGSLVQLAGLSVNIGTATLVGVTLGTLAVGQRVRVVLQAAPVANAAVATRLVRIDPTLAGALRRQALQGLVHQWNGTTQTFQLDRQAVRLSGSAVFEGGVLADIGNGARLAVFGPRGNDAVLTAERVIVYRPAIDGYVRGRVAAIDLATQRIAVQVTPGFQIEVQVLPRTLLSDRTLAAGGLTLANLALNNEVLALGWLNGSGIDAGLLQRLPQITPGVGVGGPVSSVNGTTLTILGITVTPANNAQFFDAQGVAQTSGQFFASLSTGVTVRAEGGTSGSTLLATVLRRVG